ncbi:PD-(D/E)XK nuclease family protein [Streptomyces halstedii]|uniref:PD-(D/E)XK nuclease family protein n=1 Tax=Streptomyces halstedii TaxID=1944 RepID=A0A6N9UCS0_STRHA|nr:PD-(D/E)XK nuclease family protein [Streptomyces halstedii]NEA18755.1 PD-(D/E)XK nuclease family protein [Streptomyces halstedii]
MENPPGTTGESWLVKVSTTHARTDPHACPSHLRTAVRPLLGAEAPNAAGAPLIPLVGERPRLLEDFGAGPLFAALDLWEHERWQPGRVVEELRQTSGAFSGRNAPAHPSLIAWTIQAFERYVAARTREQHAAQAVGLPPTGPVRLDWTARTALREHPDGRGARQYEHKTWGRQYASADGAVRDLWIPSFGRAKPDRPAAEKAAIAYVVAHGLPARRRARQARPPETSLVNPTPPERVRVFDFGCADGSVTPLLDWGPDTVRERFGRDAAPAFVAAATGTGVRPGASCVDCKVIGHCAELPRTPHLWGPFRGAAPFRARRRSISAWDLRLHGDCPAQYHLVRRLYLNDLSPENPGARRGRVVDAVLNARHERPLPGGCRELPQAHEGMLPPGHSLEEPLALSALRMLDEHRALCPLDGLTQDEKVLPQRRVTAYIPELDVVVLAVPDLLHTRRGRWIWRETKTAAAPLWEGRPLLRAFPQLALAVLLFDKGAVGEGARRGRVELEHLREGAGESRLEAIDPSRPATVVEAQEVIADLAEPLLRDTSYEPRTGRHCRTCQVRTWCAPGTAYVSASPSTSVPDAAPGSVEPA